MTSCCRRNSMTDYETINDTESTKKVSKWRGQKVSYFCGGPFPHLGANVAWHLTLIAVFTACASVFPLLILNPHRENVLESSGDDKGIVGICVGGATVAIMSIMSCSFEAHTFCDLRKKRLYPSPCTAYIAALVTFIALAAVFENQANQEMQTYNSTNFWINKTIGVFEKNCTGTVVANYRAMTLDNCSSCEEDYLLNPFKGPYQSILLPDVNVSFCNVDYPFCGLQLDWFHNILSNWTVPGRSYLCGVQMTETTDSTTDAWEHSMCVQSYLATRLGLYPPMILEYTQLNEVCGNLAGFATNHRSLLARCYPNAVFKRNCDTHYAATFFKELQMSISFMQNQSLPFPERAYQVMELVNKPAMVFAPKMALGASLVYEAAMLYVRNFIVENHR